MKRFLSGVLFILALSSPIPAQAAISLVQHTTQDAGIVTSSSQAFGSNNIAGHFIAVVIRSGRSGEALTVSDSRGNTYRQATLINVSLDTPMGDTLAIYYAENIGSGANTITISQSLSATLRFAILEYSGIATANSLEGGVAAQSGSASASSGNITTTTAGDLLLGAVLSANERTFTAGTGFAIQDRIPAAPNTKLITEDRIQTAAGSAAAIANLSSTDVWAAAIAAFRPGATTSIPDLRITNTHVGSFVAGQNGAAYTLTVSNNGTGPTVGMVTLTDILPIGMTATSLSGAGWFCTIGTLTCTRSDALAAGGTYAPIALTVNIAGSASGTLTNSATVSGGGETNLTNNSANDPTTIASVADLQLTKTHAGSFTQGQSGAAYTLAISNVGAGPTVGTITLTDTLPSSLTATSIAGIGWSCALSTLVCTRNDVLPPAASFPIVTLTVAVSSAAPVSVINSAAVSGGGDLSPGNNVASDVTAILPGSVSQPPTAPGALTAIPISGSRIDLSWTAATDDTGVTSYRVERCQGAGCTNFSEIATQNAGPITGPLSVSANPNYFQDASGTPIILNGSQTWNSLQDWGTNGSIQPLDFSAFVNFMVAHGQNFTLLWRTELPKFCGLPTTANSPPDFTVGPHPWARTGPGTATDGGPKFDLSQFDQAYFDRLRTRVQALNAANIYAGVYLFTGEWLEDFRCASDGYPLSGSNNVNGIDDGGGIGSMTMTSANALSAFQDAYVRKVIDTLNDLPNVLWIISEEAPANTNWWQAHQISLIRSHESGKPYRHPVGYGVRSDSNDSTLLNSDADWIAPFVRISPTTSCGSGTPVCKVNINDSDHSYFGMWNDSAQTNRNYAWQNFTNGNQVLFMDPYVVYYPRENRNLCASPINGICAGPDARWNNFRDNLGWILSYSRKLNLANVRPQSSICSTGNCLAQTPSAGAEYLIYSPNGGSFTVNLSAMSSARTLAVEWFNPSTGATIPAASIPAGSSARSFTPPFSGDAVLYLVDSTGHAGSPPSALYTSFVDTALTPNTMYRYRVRAADASANLGPYSPIASATTVAVDTQAPSVPVGLTASMVSASQIALTWAISNDNVGVAGYAIDRCAGANCTSFVSVGNTTIASFTDSGLSASTSYSYRVRATDAANNLSGYSIVATASTAAVPSGISLIQHIGKDAGVTLSTTLAFAASNAAGNFIAVAIRAGQSGQTFTVTDTRNNTYRKAVQLNETVDGTTVAIYYAENIAAGVNTVSVYNSQSNTLRIAIFEYSSLAISNSLDATAAAQGTSNAPNSGNAAMTTPGDLVFGVVSTADPASFTNGVNLTIQERVPSAPNTKLLVEDRLSAPLGSALASATLGTSDNWGAVVAAFRPGAAAGPMPDLRITKSHTGSFAQGQNGATYAIGVSNIGTGPTSGTVTMSDTLPSGLTATALAGAGWNCLLAPLGCTRSDSIAAGGTYPPITLTVNVAANAAASLVNVVTVSGGGQSNTSNDTASDTASVTGGGTVPLVSLNPVALDFGSVSTGASSASKAATLTNTGGSTLSIAGITIVGVNSGDFAQTNNCGASLAPNTSCQITATFTPVGLGARSASIRISDNAAGSPHTVALTGTGTTFSIVPRVSVLTTLLAQPFSVTGGSGGIITWAVDGTPGGSAAAGTISATGVYTPPAIAGVHTVTATDQLQLASATVHISTYPGTFTRDVDNFRTGLNSRETVLTTANVNAAQFGKLLTYAIDGVSDASPLYVANLNIPGKGPRNVVYVATEHDSVYAFDADGLQSTPLWKVSFIDPAHGITTVPPDDTGECCDISPEIGITGSPVIDSATNTLYVVAKTKEVVSGNTSYAHRLHALDLTTGAEKFGGPVAIQASVVGTGSGASGGRVSFISLRENQRAAMLLSNGVVYVSFSGHGDQAPYHGWVFGYSAATLQQVMVYNSSRNGAGAGIWQSGDGLATDSTGNLFFVTGNGTFDANVGGLNYGDSFMKLSPAGTVLDYFTPHDQAAMDAADIDFGSAGTILLPDQGGAHPHLAITAGKNGTVYVVDRDNMGHFQSGSDSQIVQTLVNVFPHGTFITGNFKAPVYWNGHLYFSADADYIKSFTITNGVMSTNATSLSSFVANYPGATLAASSNGNTNGILWAIERVDLDPVGGTGVRGPGSLHAFDATNLGIELYNSNQAAGQRDTMEYAAKWAAPLIANGKVFVATNGRLTVFGLLP